MLIRISYLFAPFIFVAFGLIGVASSWGQGTPDHPMGTSPGFVVPESIKGFDEERSKTIPSVIPAFDLKLNW